MPPSSLMSACFRPASLLTHRHLQRAFISALALAFLISVARADVPLPPDGKAPPKAEVSSITTVELAGFADQPAEVRSLITRALEFTKKNLTYRFGSSDPSLGGMDCSGTIYRLLQDHGLKDTPRQSDEMCAWVRDGSRLHLTEGVSKLDDEKLKSLQPGDLIFWSGTYSTQERKLPITHVMLYLGRRAKDLKPVIYGASDGRSYEGQRRCGVSVFDFKIPRPGDKAALHSYGPIPGLVKEQIKKPQP